MKAREHTTVQSAGVRVPDSAGRPTRPRAQRRREDLIEATVMSVAKHGVAGATLERVAEAAEVSRGLPRHYFGNKSSLLSAAFERLAIEFVDSLGQSSRESVADPLAALDEAIETVFRQPHFNVERLQAWFGFWHMASRDPSLAKVNDWVTKRHVEILSDLVSQAAGLRGLTVDPQRIGLGLTLLMDGAFAALASGSTMTTDAAEEICKRYVRMALGCDV